LPALAGHDAIVAFMATTDPRIDTYIAKSAEFGMHGGKVLAHIHQREYIEWLMEAKRAETREKRLAQAVEWLEAGKSRNWKYQDCQGRQLKQAQSWSASVTRIVGCVYSANTPSSSAMAAP
jgi:hypothetical protein